MILLLSPPALHERGSVENSGVHLEGRCKKRSEKIWNFRGPSPKAFLLLYVCAQATCLLKEIQQQPKNQVKQTTLPGENLAYQ